MRQGIRPLQRSLILTVDRALPWLTHRLNQKGWEQLVRWAASSGFRSLVVFTRAHARFHGDAVKWSDFSRKGGGQLREEWCEGLPDSICPHNLIRTRLRPTWTKIAVCIDHAMTDLG